MVGDWMQKWDPPTYPLDPQRFPTPSLPAPTWPLEKLKEYEELLKRIKALEDSIGCPCPIERGKPDYLAIIREAIDKLESEQRKTP